MVTHKYLNILLQLLGGSSGGDEILEWNPTTEQWKEVGKISSRYYHGIAVVDVADIISITHCTYN